MPSTTEHHAQNSISPAYGFGVQRKYGHRARLYFSVLFNDFDPEQTSTLHDKMPSQGSLAMPEQSAVRGVTAASFTSALDTIVAQAMGEWKVPGLAISVVRHGEVALLRAYGHRDVEVGLPVTTDTQFTICSITKSFTSTGLALLVEAAVPFCPLETEKAMQQATAYRAEGGLDFRKRVWPQTARDM